jgi:BirA family biotin operon repressor/biotin-[acetyl-CoA-carboxylase] ligase
MNDFRVNIIRFDSLPSTNTEIARQAALGAEEGLCILAAEQTAGRGRLQRKWISPKGAGLYFSVLLKPDIDQRLWPLLTLTASLAVQEALYQSCGLETDLKWPNDLLFKDQKLCGILAETIEMRPARAVVVGIGINLTSKAFPTELDGLATSVEAATGRTPDLEVILEALVSSFARHYQTLQRPAGPEIIIREWCARSSYAQGKTIRVIDGKETFAGTTRGLEIDGALRLETAPGEIKVIRAGEVTAARPA